MRGYAVVNAGGKIGFLFFSRFAFLFLLIIYFQSVIYFYKAFIFIFHLCVTKTIGCGTCGVKKIKLRLCFYPFLHFYLFYYLFCSFCVFCIFCKSLCILLPSFRSYPFGIRRETICVFIVFTFLQFAVILFYLFYLFYFPFSLFYFIVKFLLFDYIVIEYQTVIIYYFILFYFPICVFVPSKTVCVLFVLKYVSFCSCVDPKT